MCLKSTDFSLPCIKRSGSERRYRPGLVSEKRFFWVLKRSRSLLSGKNQLQRRFTSQSAPSEKTKSRPVVQVVQLLQVDEYRDESEETKKIIKKIDEFSDCTRT